MSSFAGRSARERRRFDVAIYDGDGIELLQGATDGRYLVENLAFASGLPGGFLSASFRVARPTSRSWPGRPGLPVAIRRGNRVLWWGWIEDTQRLVRGSAEEIRVTAFGPWQQLQQRLCSVDYSGTLYGHTAIGGEIAWNCPDISLDFSDLTATGVNIAPLVWDNQPVSDLVELVCETGNNAGQPLLFALREPTYRAERVNLLTNGGFEQQSGVSTYTGWTLSGSLPTVTDYHSGVRGASRQCGTTGYVRQTAAFAADVYSIAYLSWWARATSTTPTMTCTVVWYDAGGSTLRTDTTSSVNHSTSWRAYAAGFFPPSTARSCQVTISTTGSTSSHTWHVDDVILYDGRPKVPSIRPRARLWARDLSGWDYQLYTADLDAGLAAVETTREVANYVVARYGSSYTSAAEDADSQALYRRRDTVLNAGDVASTVATALRDAHLARYKTPAVEAGAIRLQRPGAVRTAQGLPIWPEDLRAGDRLLIADGPNAGQVLLLTRVEYADGVVTATPERPDDVPLLLAKVK